jgi:hypothetical protein
MNNITGCRAVMWLSSTALLALAVATPAAAQSQPSPSDAGTAAPALPQQLSVGGTRPVDPSQMVGRGTVQGRILNTVTGDYLRNAEVSIAGTTMAARSEGDGRFRLTGVPAGTAEIIVRYTGC